MKSNNILRRLQCLCLSLLLIISTIGVVPVYAAGTTEVIFGEAIAKVGDEAIVPVSIKNNPGITSFRFRVSYDTDKFEFISATEGALLTKGTLSDITDAAAETMTFQWFAEENIYGDGNLVELKFKVLENARGEHSLNVTYLENDIVNEDWGTIPFTVSEGTISVICADSEHKFSLNGSNTCQICKYSKTPNAPTIQGKTNNSISLVAISGLEYSINGIDWQTSSTFSNLSPGTTYVFYQRVKPSNSAFVSEKSAGLSVVFKAVPTSSPAKPEVLGYTDTTITLKPVSGCEYSKDGSAWQTSNVFTGLNPVTSYTFYQRYFETDTHEASGKGLGLTVKTDKSQQTLVPNKPTVQNITSNSITLNAVDGCEYSKDGSTWQTSNVFSNLSPATNYTFYQRYSETKTHKASEKSTGATFKTDKAKQTIVPNAPTVQSFTANSVTLSPVNGCEYSKDGITWQASNVFNNLECGTKYTFYQRYKETATTYASNSSSPCATKTDKGTQAVVSAPTLLSKTYISVTLALVSGCEYSKDGSTWQTSNTFTGLSPETNYTFYQRKAETDRYYAGAASTGLTVKTAEKPIVLTSIAITTKPTKLTYLEGESLDETGMVVTAYYDNNTNAVISDYTISGYTSTVGTKTITVSYGGKTATFSVTVNSRVPSSITSTKHTVKENTVSKITAGTTVSSLLAGVNEGSYCKVYKGNTEVSGNTAVGTGMVVKIMDGNTVKASYTIIVTGDTNGDGNITVTDMIAIKAHVLKKSTLSGVYATAADTNGDKGISITDFIQVKAKILGKGSITAR